MRAMIFVMLSWGVWFSHSTVVANDLPTEDDFYKWVNIPIPEDIVLEVGGIEELPGQKLAVSTRRGDIYFIDGAVADQPENVKFAGWPRFLNRGREATRGHGVWR